MRRPWWYLGTPYSRYESGLDAAAKDAAVQAAILIRENVDVFSPIAHSHFVAVYGGLDPLAHGLWMDLDKSFMESAYGLIVCQLPGWQESKGLKIEWEHFETRKRPIILMTPWDPPVESILNAQEGRL